MSALEKTEAARPHVIVVGAGFAGLGVAEALGGAAVRVTVIDRHNYHLFVPLLYQVATAGLSPADVAEPIRHILGRHDNVEVRLGEVTGVESAGIESAGIEGAGVEGAGWRVHLADGDTLACDRLVIATGSRQSYFGHDDWEAHAPGLRSIADARSIRSRLLMAFERAEMTRDAAERDRLLTVVVVGGGPTGVELAGAISELARHALSRDFRNIDPRSTRILLVEAGPRLLAGFPETLSDYAARALRRLGVEVRTGAAVEEIAAGSIVVAGETIEAGTLLWGAGVAASPAGQWLGVETDKGGRVEVAPDLSVPGLEGVYVLGDTAMAAGEDGQPLPGLAQVAKQQGEHLGRQLRRNLESGAPLEPFRFRDRGNMATIGRHAAVADFGRFRLRGRLAWLLWSVVHVYLLIGFENRLKVSLQWLWAWLTYQRGARLITHQAPGSDRREGPPEE